jgi:hypothetical protein
VDDVNELFYQALERDWLEWIKVTAFVQGNIDLAVEQLGAAEWSLAEYRRNDTYRAVVKADPDVQRYTKVV